MKVLLVSINAKFIHTNSAVYLLSANAGEFRKDVKIREFTINQSLDGMLQGIVEEKPDFIGFSCYIWNIDIVKKLVRECKKLLPSACVWLGGPEAEADAVQLMQEYPQIDGVMYGEGEMVLPEILRCYDFSDSIMSLHEQCESTKTDLSERLSDVSGIFFRMNGGVIKSIPAKPVDLNELVFPYNEEILRQLSGKIIYYESSRGCPFHCSYCLSSEDNHVRFRSVDKVKKDLNLFLETKTPQVKFVDRTFNCNHKRMTELLQFMLEQDNGVTNFHFEIGGDLLTEEELDILQQFRPGAIQLEIGVQTTNAEVMERIGRVNKKDTLFANVRKLLTFGKQHIHLDLIAGLPGENLQSFIRSFDEVYNLHPHQLQLGFLKVLANTRIHREAGVYGITYREYPPYEVLETDSISYQELLELKQVEEMVEIYYNSGQFAEELRFAEHYFADSPYRMYRELARLYFSRYMSGMQSSRMARYELLVEFIKSFTEETMHDVVVQLAVYDCYARERKKARPAFSLKNDGEYMVKSMMRESDRAIVYHSENHAELFSIDVKKTAETGTAVFKGNIAVFHYELRSPITGNADVICYDL